MMRTRIVGIDPGRVTGIAVMSVEHASLTPTVEEWEIYRYPTKTDNTDLVHLRGWCAWLQEFLKEHAPNVIVFEVPDGQVNAQTIRWFGRYDGVLVSLCDYADMTVGLRPATVRHSLNAILKQDELDMARKHCRDNKILSMALALRLLRNQTPDLLKHPVFEREAIADAIAIAFAGCFCMPFQPPFLYTKSSHAPSASPNTQSLFFRANST